MRPLVATLVLVLVALVAIMHWAGTPRPTVSFLAPPVVTVPPPPGIPPPPQTVPCATLETDEWLLGRLQQMTALARVRPPMGEAGLRSVFITSTSGPPLTRADVPRLLKDQAYTLSLIHI